MHGLSLHFTLPKGVSLTGNGGGGGILAAVSFSEERICILSSSGGSGLAKNSCMVDSFDRLPSIG